VFAPGDQPHFRILAPHGLLDLIEQRDLAQHLLGYGGAVALEAFHEAAADMGPAIHQLPRAGVARDLRQRVVGLVGVALQEPAAVSGEELQRMLFPPAGGVVEQNDGWADTAMTTVVGHDGPEEAALGGLAARVQHRRAGLVGKDAVRAAQMSFHVIDDRHQVETGTADPVAKCASIQIDPLPLEDLGLAVKWQVVTELGHDDRGDEQFDLPPETSLSLM